MSYDTYRLIFIGAAIACGVMFLVSVTLFFVFKIPNIIGNLTGRNAKKASKRGCSLAQRGRPCSFTRRVCRGVLMRLPVTAACGVWQ